MKPIPYEAQKVLLVGDPPAAYKFKDEIQALGYEVDHVRCEHSPTKVLAAITPGIAFCVAMNLRGQGAAVKEACRRVGATFISVPPSWTAAQKPLEQAGLMVETARPLAHRPFSGLAATKAAIASQVIEKLEDTLSKAPVVLGEPAFVPPDKPKEEKPEPPPAPAKVVGIKLRTPPSEPPAPEPEAAPKAPGERRPAVPSAHYSNVGHPGPPIGAREKSLELRRAIAEQKAAMVRKLFEAGPDLDPDEVNAQVAAKFGGGLSGTRMYEIRREVRTALGLHPTHSDRPRKRPGSSAHPQPPPVLAPAESGGLPAAVLAAQAKLVEALRAAGGVKSYGLTYLDGECEVEFEAQVITTAKGKSSL